MLARGEGRLEDDASRRRSSESSTAYREMTCPNQELTEWMQMLISAPFVKVYFRLFFNTKYFQRAMDRVITIIIVYSKICSLVITYHYNICASRGFQYNEEENWQNVADFQDTYSSTLFFLFRLMNRKEHFKA